jgi:hypothetical protein
MMARYLAVKNFDQFQHYRDRSPPWIKLHQGVLEDYEFSSLPDASKWHLVAIWLLASRSDNRIPHDPTWVAAKIGARSKVDLAGLIESGFLVDISGATDDVAPRKQAASEPLERAEQSRGRAEQRYAPIGAGLDVFEERFWKPYPRKVGKGAALKAWRTACKTADPEQIIAGLTRFRWPDDHKFTPHPATWLNAQRWLDEPTHERPAGGLVVRGPTLAQARAEAAAKVEPEVPLEERQRVGAMLGELRAKLVAGGAA